MKVVQCINGHFYDSDKYAGCPHCGMAGNIQKTEQGLPKVDGDWSRRSRTGSTSGGYGTHTDGTFRDIGTGNNVQARPYDSSSESTVLMTDTVYCFNCGKAVKSGDRFCQYCGAVISQDDQEGTVLLNLTPDRNEVQSSENRQVQVHPVTPSIPPQPLTKPNVITPVQASAQKPVVGWIVCLKGNLIGNSFSILKGKNSIGRESENAIVLPGDESVLAKGHAFIAFDPNKNFFVLPGAGEAYVNDVQVAKPKYIKANDVIRIGSGEYLFVPLCTKEFDWDKYLG